MLPLDAMPEELLSLTLSKLAQHELFTACQVCQAFYRISRPILYRNVDFTGPYVRHAIIQLCQRLSINPQLSNCLRSLSLAGEAPSMLSMNLVEKKISFPKLDTLLLLRVKNLWMTELKTLLVSTPNLETLICDFDFELDVRPDKVPPPYLDCKALRNSILPVRSTLRRLNVSLYLPDYGTAVGVYGTAESDYGTAEGSYEYIDAWGITGDMGSLQAFEKLEELKVPIVVLLGWSADTGSTLSQNLSPNLSTLVLTNDLQSVREYEWDYNATFSKVEEFLRNRSKTPTTTTLSFEVICVPASMMHNGHDFPETAPWRELEATYNRPGISFRQSTLADIE